MRYYKECLWCGAHLDPGESCDCQKEKAPEKKLQAVKMTYISGRKKHVS